MRSTVDNRDFYRNRLHGRPYLIRGVCVFVNDYGNRDDSRRSLSSTKVYLHLLRHWLCLMNRGPIFLLILGPRRESLEC